MNCPRRILVVNPNTSRTVTGWLAAEACRVAGLDMTIDAINAASGLAAIETPDDIAQAARAVIDAIRARPGIDAALIAAFGDPGLHEARDACTVPVIGLGEAGLQAAARGGRRFGIVTLGVAMTDPIRARTLTLGLARQCTGLTILPFSIGEMVADRTRYRPAIMTAVRACFDRRGADAVLLGGAPFAGLAHGLAGDLGRTVLDGVEASFQLLPESSGADPTGRTTE